MDIIPTDDFRTAVDIHYDFDFWLAETLKSKKMKIKVFYKMSFWGNHQSFGHKVSETDISDLI